MKITQLIAVLISLILVGAGVKYSMDQQKVMNLLVATHGNGELVKGGGIYQVQEDLRKDVDAAALARKAAVESSEKARLKKNDASDKRVAAAEALVEKKAELEEWNDKVEESEARVAKIKAEYETSMAQVSKDLGDQFPDISEADLSSYVQAVKDYVESTQEEISTLKKELDGQDTIREDVVTRIAKTKVDISRVEEIQAQFAADYKKNASEYVVANVDNRWNFVVFFAEPSDGLLPGDTVPLLSREGGEAIATLEIESVKGNVVVARYDENSLGTGREIVVGDRLFRKKPLGH